MEEEIAEAIKLLRENKKERKRARGKGREVVRKLELKIKRHKNDKNIGF